MSTSYLVADYQKERSDLLSFLKEQSRLIRQQPTSDSIQEAKVNLRDYANEYLERLADAAIAMASEATDHVYVTAKPANFYSVLVPDITSLLQIRMPQLAARLGLNPKCDMCVHFIIEGIMADPVF
ncbi:uncharacterized protein N7479_009560 [Penicillium vulpinum]|uniref:Uncharacterized protein n=1 Tax=Penicillium vulpinum TaxID=29845 RepID=A0A1V6RZ90_9EURO|nr:uncharacterized protein N7479_009560 [Penicillium vulpinum]KAJ5951147.1 hypothetical protein N7479_009560 [Penicillium vulpinum]OQE06829.1 hypothetical protein PENVUL_c016G06328 [Penicillium vulpinum]